MSESNSANQDPAMRETIGALVGRIPSGLYIVTVADGQGRETGMLASWVQQAAFQPLAVTVAIHQKRYLNEWIAATERIALSIVGQSQTDLLKHFGKGFEPDEPAFEGLATSTTPAGLTVLADSLGFLEGRVSGRLDAGDHRVYVVQLTAGGRGSRFGDESPYVHLRKSGRGY